MTNAPIEYTCGGCPIRWTGLSTCHCSGCHRTFGGVSLFDSHRSVAGPHGSCRDPQTLRDHGEPLRLIDGVWRGQQRPPESLPGGRRTAVDAGSVLR